MKSHKGVCFHIHVRSILNSSLCLDVFLLFCIHDFKTTDAVKLIASTPTRKPISLCQPAQEFQHGNVIDGFARISQVKTYYCPSGLPAAGQSGCSSFFLYCVGTPTAKIVSGIHSKRIMDISPGIATLSTLS